MISYKSEGKFDITGRGTVFLVINNGTSEERHLIGKQVLIDDTPYQVIGVENQGEKSFQKGGKMGLLIREIIQDGDATNKT